MVLFLPFAQLVASHQSSPDEIQGSVPAVLAAAANCYAPARFSDSRMLPDRLKPLDNAGERS